MNYKNLSKIVCIYLCLIIYKILKIIKKQYTRKSILESQKVLVLYITGFGDIFCLTEFFKRIRLIFPQSELIGCFPSRCIEVQKSFFEFDRYIRHESLYKTYLTLLKEDFDLIILPGWVLKNSFLAMFSKTKSIVGFINDVSKRNVYQGINKLETIGLPSEEIYQNQKYHHLSERPNPILRYFSYPELNSSDLLINRVNVSESYIVLHTGGKYPGRRWPFDNFIEIIKFLLSKNPDRKIYLIGDHTDKERNKLICSLINNPNCLDLTDKLSFIASTDLIKSAILFIGNDSGPMHISALSGVPTLGLFGPNIPNISGPLGKQSKYLFHILPCSGCHQRKCYNKYLCIRLISIEEVIEVLERLLSDVNSENL